MIKNEGKSKGKKTRVNYYYLLLPSVSLYKISKKFRSLRSLEYSPCYITIIHILCYIADFFVRCANAS